MKRIFIYTPLILIAVAGATLAHLNAASVTFDFYFSSIKLSLAALLYAALVVGVVLGFVASFGMYLSARREARRLRKRLAMCEQEVENLRAIPIKEKF